MSISAIVTTYKREPNVIKEAIYSIHNQTHAVDEIIIVDDNRFESEYPEQIQSMIDSLPFKVKYIKQTENNGNMGACAARNLGIQNSFGDFVAFLDDDDAWLPTKIEKQIERFTSDTIGLVFCCGSINQETEEGTRVFDYFTSKYFKEEVTHHDMLVYDYVGSTSNPLIRRECFEKCGAFDVDMPARQDYEMWLRVSQYYKIVGIEEKLFLHNLHLGEQISTNSTKSLRGYYLLYKKHEDEYKKDALGRYAKMKMLAKLAVNKDFRIFAWSVYGMIESRFKIVINKIVGDHNA